MFLKLLSQPVNRLLILSMVVVAVLPISLLGFHVNKTAWDNSWREIHEKHELLAQNLTSPIQVYVENHFDTLNLLSGTISPLLHQPKLLQTMMDTSVSKLRGFASMTYVNASGKMKAYKVADDILFDKDMVSAQVFKNEKCFLTIKQTRKQFVSGIKPSPFTLNPTIIMGVPVFNAQSKLTGVLLAELRVSLLEELRAEIKFGTKGHSAIVDQNGRVIAHPNSQWMQEMKNLSHWPIVQAMKAGKQGTTEFYSSFMKADMVAGYASVTDIGWGVMVPQPKSEVMAQVNEFMFSNYLWAAIGLVIALVIGCLMSRWITHPIDRLAKTSQVLLDNDLKGDIESPADFEPREARQLGYALKSLVRGLQHTRKDVDDLNANLHQKVNDATKQLRVANEKLEETCKSDFLTSLANRRFFEMDLSDALQRRKKDSEHISLMLFDIDNFKYINDTYGHAAGDEVLTRVARTLETFMRKGDVVARYAGDEFVLRLQCEGDIAASRANQIRQAIENLNIIWRQSELHITVSIGIYSDVLSDDLDMRNILHNVDIAMYEAKKRGRNCVKTYKREMASMHILM